MKHKCIYFDFNEFPIVSLSVLRKEDEDSQGKLFSVICGDSSTQSSFNQKSYFVPTWGKVVNSNETLKKFHCNLFVR